jgi:hypothetical protein
LRKNFGLLEQPARMVNTGLALGQVLELIRAVSQQGRPAGLS